MAPALRAKASLAAGLVLLSSGMGALPIITATKLYMRIDQVNLKKAYTNTAISTTSRNSQISREGTTPNGMVANTSMASLVYPSAVMIPARISRQLEAKNAPLRSRLPTTEASEIRFSRLSITRIQSSRYKSRVLERQARESARLREYQV